MSQKKAREFYNKQLFCECQLVALWNACKFSGGSVPCFGGQQYHSICKDSRGIAGGCINIEREKRRLGLVSVRGCYKLKWIRENLPVHFALFTKHRGYHSVLAVKVYRNKILFANYAHGRVCWLRWRRVLELANKRTLPFMYKLSKP